MKKKPKLIFKINRNNSAKIYVGGKWQKYVASAEIYAEPFNHDVVITQYKRNEQGGFAVENDNPVYQTKKFHFGAGG